MTIAPAGLREALTLRCDVTQPWEARADVLVVIHPAGGSDAPGWLASHAEQIRALGDGEQLTLHRGSDATHHARVVEVFALAGAVPEATRRAGRRIGAGHRDASSFAVSGLSLGTSEAAVLAFIRGFAEARYRFSRYRTGSAVAPAELALVGAAAASVAGFHDQLQRAEIVESAVQVTRDLTNTPARDLTPALFAERAVAEAERAGASVRVFGEEWLTGEGFAGLVSVGAGSPHPPCLVEVSYRGKEAGDAAPIILVGKGVTFDSGGLSLKKASAMADQKSDMAGAATALAVVCAIARLADPRAHVVALLALAENMPGPLSLRPGDIITHRNGVTTEVVNTDCEGRLVMSDVLSWAAERRPAALIDIATLTYSTISALGTEITSVMGSDAAVIAAIRSSGEATGDPYWELPLWAPYRRLIDSPFADIRNEEDDGGPGAITAALFLREFTAGLPWAHLDLGGTAYLDEATDDLEAGATGVCVRSLIHLTLARPFITRKGAAS